MAATPLYIQVPPIGAPDDHGTLAFVCNGLIQESMGVRDEFLQNLQPCTDQYLWGRPEGRDEHQSTFNKTQTEIHSFVDLAIKNIPVVSVDPSCVGDQPDHYLVDPVDGVDISQPVPDQMLANLPPGATIAVDIGLVTDYLQSVFDIQWERSRTNQFLRDNVLFTQIEGTQFSTYEWDDQDQRHILANPPTQQMYPDPTCSDIKDMAYFGYDAIIDANLAKRMYPELETAINDTASESIYLAQNAVNYSSLYTDPIYKRGIVTMRKVWMRNQQCLLSADEAVSKGIVDRRQVPDASQPATLLQKIVGGAKKLLGLGGNNESIAQDQEGVAGEPADHGQPADPDDGLPAGVPGAGAGQVNQQVTREALVHRETGEEISPLHPDWPTKLCNRVVTMIWDRVVGDRVCETWDFPIVRNVNTPYPRRPFGQGEPTRIESEQRDLNSLHSAQIKNALLFRAPTMIGDLSVKELFPDQFKNAFMQPDKIYWADLSGLDGQPPLQIINPPPMPPSVPQTKAELVKAMDITGGYAEVSQGSAQDLSGTAIAQLQNAATSTASFRFLYFEETVYRLSRLMLHSIVTRMDTPSLMRINRKYPAHIVDAIRQRAQGIEWNVKVEVSSNAGQVKAQKDAQTMQLFQAGLLDEESACDRLGLDFDQIQQRKQRINQQQQGAQAAVAGVQPQQGPPQQLTNAAPPA
jgi:hypothetical protein